MGGINSLSDYIEYLKKKYKIKKKKVRVIVPKDNKSNTSKNNNSLL